MPKQERNSYSIVRWCSCTHPSTFFRWSINFARFGAFSSKWVCKLLTLYQTVLHTIIAHLIHRAWAFGGLTHFCLHIVFQQYPLIKESVTFLYFFGLVFSGSFDWATEMECIWTNDRFVFRSKISRIWVSICIRWCEATVLMNTVCEQ